jgi:hypothetical protein
MMATVTIICIILPTKSERHGLAKSHRAHVRGRDVGSRTMRLSRGREKRESGGGEGWPRGVRGTAGRRPRVVVQEEWVVA